MNVEVMAKVNVKIQKENLATGNIRTEEYHNLAVDVGLNLIRDFMNGDAVTGLNGGRFALGTSSTLEAPTDTALGMEVFRDQFTKITKLDKGLEIKYFLSSTSANGNAIAEAGLFGNGATGTAGSGTMYARVTFPAEDKTNAEAWTFTWTLTWEVV
jgi:hypothetical protein